MATPAATEAGDPKSGGSRRRLFGAPGKNWDPENLYHALCVVFLEKKLLSCVDAESNYRIPRATYSRYRASMTRYLQLPDAEFPATVDLFCSVLPSRGTVLGPEVEQKLVTRLLELAACGFPLTKKFVIARVQEYVKMNNNPWPRRWASRPRDAVRLKSSRLRRRRLLSCPSSLRRRDNGKPSRRRKLLRCRLGTVTVDHIYAVTMLTLCQVGYFGLLSAATTYSGGQGQGEQACWCFELFRAEGAGEKRS